MAKLRKGVAYRKLERPYTRISKYRQKSFIRTARNIRVVRFNMGETNRKFQYTLNLLSKSSFQLRHNAIEAARQSSNRLLEKVLGKSGYFMKIRVYPHHVLREHALASGAGADRFSSGMAHSFGKPVGNAAQLRTGQAILSAYINENNLDLARTAFKKSIHKLPCRGTIKVIKL